jgi:hypothetical protein
VAASEDFEVPSAIEAMMARGGRQPTVAEALAVVPASLLQPPARL